MPELCKLKPGDLCKGAGNSKSLVMFLYQVGTTLHFISVSSQAGNHKQGEVFSVSAHVSKWEKL